MAAQADTRDEVRAKLDSMIVCYVEDALAGEDFEHRAALVHRKSTIYVWLKYHLYAVLDGLRGSTNSSAANIFERIAPLAPIVSAS